MAAVPHVARLYYINLDLRPDRNEHVIRSLGGCPWPYQRVQAVRLERPPSDLGYNLAKRHTSRPHVASIWLSHEKALRTALTCEDDGLFIVLEDDIQLSPKLWDRPAPVPDDMPSDWEMIIVSPRYRVRPVNPRSVEAPRWLDKPFGKALVSAPNASRDVIVTGAHFCVFRDKAAITSVLEKMDTAPEIDDVDIWFLANAGCYTWHNDYVGTKGALGSNHQDQIGQ